MSEKLNERLTILNICTKFEKDHHAEVIVYVEPDLDLRQHHWMISMTAAGFTPDGKFSKGTYRKIIFKRNDSEDVVVNALNDMYVELYDV